jgi:hypothetical protein
MESEKRSSNYCIPIQKTYDENGLTRNQNDPRQGYEEETPLYFGGNVN